MEMPVQGKLSHTHMVKKQPNTKNSHGKDLKARKPAEGT